MPLIGKELSLYFHIPFCQKKCDYCHFYVIPNNPSFIERYMVGLEKEWRLRKSFVEAHRDKIVSVYFGGGTPSLLGAKHIKTILSWIGTLPPQTEITLEANPENLEIAPYIEAGINRVSIGVQSFDDPLLSHLSRTHSSKAAQKAILQTSNSGCSNITIDLMYDLPYQTLSSWKKSLEIATSLPVSHISLYNLTIEPKTIFHKHKKDLQKTIPSEEVSSELLKMALNHFETNHFNRYEISAFAKNNVRSYHNIGYWTGRPYLGFGPSACSYIGQTRLQNISHFNRYLKLLESNRLPVEFSETLSAKRQLKEALVLNLRLVSGVQVIPFEKKWGILPEETLSILDHLKEEELLISHLNFGLPSSNSEGFMPQILESSDGIKAPLQLQEDNCIKLTERGLLFYDHIASLLI